MKSRQRRTTISMHPIDILAGTLVPQTQSYLVCMPPVTVEPSALRSLIDPLIRHRFPRLGYRFLRRAGTYGKLRQAEDIAQPVTMLTLQEMEGKGVEALQEAAGDRHWHLFVATSPKVCILILMFDHFLCHGDTARWFLLATCDRLRGAEAGAGPLRLTREQEAAFLGFQQTLTDRFHARAPWAVYHRLRFAAKSLQRLASALGQPFTDTIILWLARTIQDVSHRSRPMKILSFRMDPDAASEEVPDAAFGNKHLEIRLFHMHPQGGYMPIGPPREERIRREAKFIRFYRRFPCKRLLNWLIFKGVEKGYRKSRKEATDQLVVNNMGSTDYPFFRTMFFNPVAKEADRFGLVFVDGHRGEVTLQFSPPKRYLEHFDWQAFVRRLEENLEGLAKDPGAVAGTN